MPYLYSVILQERVRNGVSNFLIDKIMSVKYRLVLRRDMSKDAAADAKLFYAASSSNGMCDLTMLCDIIADRSAATAGDVKLVLDGLLFVVSVLRR